MTALDGIKVSPQDGGASFDVDTRIYGMDAVMGTAYVFINRAYVLLDQPGPGRIRVQLSGKTPLRKDAVKALCGDFLNELLGQVLRERQAKRYGTLREALLAKAIFAAAPGLANEGAGQAEPAAPTGQPPGEFAAEPSLADLPDESADYLEDPLKIAMPWEERYGQKDDKGKKDGGQG
jgi:His-Xaa-Ser system protein HxsD